MPYAAGMAGVGKGLVATALLAGALVGAAPAARASLAPAAGASRWVPGTGQVEWQWELDHPLDLSSAKDMGTGDKTYTGAPAGAPSVYDIDGFDNPASTVTALHARGDHVVCYIEVGAAENYRPDYAELKATGLGKRVPGYPDERYLNIRKAQVLSIIEARIHMCATKGFDAVEPDIDDSFADPTGFHITESQNVSYDTTLAAYAHSLDMSWALKNGDVPSFATQLLPVVDFALDEQCFQYDTCGAFFPAFGQAGKAVFEVQYSDEGGPKPGKFCPTANADNFDAVEFDAALNGHVRVPCR